MTIEEEECPDAKVEASLTRTKFTYSHSWQEIYDSIANDTPAYLKVSGVEDGMVVTYLDPITAIGTDNLDYYQVKTTEGGSRFPNATDKVWYEGECGR